MTPNEINKLHANDDSDSSVNAHHHTLGPGHNQASPGDHIHDGRTSKELLEGITITGSRSTGVALNNLLNALENYGLVNSSSA